MNLKYIKQTITSVIISEFLSYVLITTKDLLTRIVVIPFLIFSISLFIKNICLMLNKNKLSKVFSKINVIAFLIYWFGFLIYWDYISILNKDFMSVLFSLIFWFGGYYIFYKRLIKK